MPKVRMLIGSIENGGIRHNPGRIVDIQEINQKSLGITYELVKEEAPATETTAVPPPSLPSLSKQPTEAEILQAEKEIAIKIAKEADEAEKEANNKKGKGKQ